MKERRGELELDPEPGQQIWRKIKENEIFQKVAIVLSTLTVYCVSGAVP